MRGRRRDLLEMGLHEVEIGLGLKRRPPGQHLVERDPQRVEIDPMVDLQPLDLLRRHVTERSDQRAGHGQVALGVPHLGDPEVHHLGRPVGQDHDVGRFQVPVDHAHLVGVADGGEDLLGDPDRFRNGKNPGPVHQASERLPLEELHHQERLARLLLERVDRGDSGVGQPRLGPGLVLEPLDHLRVLGQLRRHHLESDDPAEVHVLGLVDDAHAAPADDLDHPVAAQFLPDPGIAGGRPRHRRRNAGRLGWTWGRGSGRGRRRLRGHFLRRGHLAGHEVLDLAHQLIHVRLFGQTRPGRALHVERQGRVTGPAGIRPVSVRCLANRASEHVLKPHEKLCTQ